MPTKTLGETPYRSASFQRPSMKDLISAAASSVCRYTPVRGANRRRVAARTEALWASRRLPHYRRDDRVGVPVLAIWGRRDVDGDPIDFREASSLQPTDVRGRQLGLLVRVVGEDTARAE